MLDLKSSDRKYENILFLCFIGSGIIGVLAYYFGMGYALFSTALFGIFQICIATISFAFWHIEKLRIKAKAESSNESIEELTLEEEEKFLLAQKKLQVFLRVEYPMLLLFICGLGLTGEIVIFNNLTRINLTGPIPMIIGVGSITISFVYLIITNWFTEEETKNEAFEVLPCFLKAAQWIGFCSGTPVILKALGFDAFEYYISYIILACIGVVFIEVIICCILRFFINIENDTAVLNLFLLPALVSGSNPIDGLIHTLEKKTGMSFRSTWTMYFIRRNSLFLFLIIVLVFWITSAMVQINPKENGVIYRFGRIKESATLTPGLHFKLLWPIETVETFPIHQVHSFTVGYEGQKATDYLWTQKHGGKEYKLLLGDGRELVSINMIVSYQINDLQEYILEFENPEEELRAKAYRILMKEIVATNLDSLLSRNRVSFANNIKTRLQEISTEQNLGLEVVDVALTSIHPPVEVAEAYQQLISAGIQKHILTNIAETYSEYAIPMTEKNRYESIKRAEVEGILRRSEAISETTEFAFQKEAYHINPKAYQRWKWLEAFERAVSNKKIYLLDENQSSDSDNIWLDMRNPYLGNPY